MAETYTDPAGTHRHQCLACALVWQHADSGERRPREKAHACPRCGWETPSFLTLRYCGPLPPDVVQTRSDPGRKAAQAVELLGRVPASEDQQALWCLEATRVRCQF